MRHRYPSRYLGRRRAACHTFWHRSAAAIPFAGARRATIVDTESSPAETVPHASRRPTYVGNPSNSTTLLARDPAWRCFAIATYSGDSYQRRASS